MDKLFPEHDWDDSPETSSFNFTKEKVSVEVNAWKACIKTILLQVNKKSRNTKPKRDFDSSTPGRFVRAPLPEEEFTTAKSLKRKSSECVENLNGAPKNQKRKIQSASALKRNAASNPQVPNVTKPTNFRDKLVDSLKGSRFRFINEQLYRTTGTEAKRLFQEDPSAFQAYHEGYRHQIVQWSVNPLDRIIKSFSKL